MKKFDIPASYQSHFIKKIKDLRKANDPKKKDFTPTRLLFNGFEIVLARHFGFCYGVENAIEISYKALLENPDKNIYLLSQMIHNPMVNQDLVQRGIRFIMDTEGYQLIPWDRIYSNDIVIIPAFGTTLEIKELLLQKGIDIKTYNTTCPFVEKVWKTSHKLGEDQFTILIHGKHRHEETRATFSHAQENTPSLILKDLKEAHFISDYILGKITESHFLELFKGRMSSGFKPSHDLKKVGVVNQTTMLASETHEISEYIKQTMIQKYGLENHKTHFADTRDTLCYATNDNQEATLALLERSDIDLAIVVGGHNSSNTQHLVELCEQKFKTYFIESALDIESNDIIKHYNIHANKKSETLIDWTSTNVQRIIITSGASCPDQIVEQVIASVLQKKSIIADFENIEQYIL